MTKTTLSTVRILLSHDYCHFEVSKQIEGDNITQVEIDNARKDCQRLADKAVGQYKTAKTEATKSLSSDRERQQLEIEVTGIKQRPEDTWSIYDKAKVKALADYNQDWRYDYMDDEEYEIGNE